MATKKGDAFWGRARAVEVVRGIALGQVTLAEGQKRLHVSGQQLSARVRQFKKNGGAAKSNGAGALELADIAAAVLGEALRAQIQALYVENKTLAAENALLRERMGSSQQTGTKLAELSKSIVERLGVA